MIAAFTAAMDRLGPFEPFPAVAVAVSGGADSMTLAILARDWIRARGGTILALVVDHGLRAESTDEAGLTQARLASLGIPARILPIAGLARGPGLAERARLIRYDRLSAACAEAGCLHLLLGHHAGDQAETLAMRVLRDSQTHGLAGMAALRESGGVRLLRPLLGMQPGAFRTWLTARGVSWVEDPSNRDLRALRPRLRQRLAAVSTAGLGEAVAAVGALRRREEQRRAAELACRTMIRPEGFAVLTPGRIAVEALRALIATIGGASYSPPSRQITALAAELKPATVGGVRVVMNGQSVLLVREEAAIGPPMPAIHGAIWDRRFRIVAGAGVRAEAMIGKLGDDASRFRHRSHLPSVILRTLPTIRFGETLAFVPHLGYSCRENELRFNVLFSPPMPAAGATFVAAA